ncbi:cation:proton antiporter [Fulvivirgaceae bacterium LMO-SS25]
MNLYDFLYYIILPILSISALMVFIRFIKGPHIADRVLSLDLLITIGLGIITIISVITNQSTFLDIALIFALIAFLSTVAFSYYLEQKSKKK